jgi:hypothetical protein
LNVSRTQSTNNNIKENVDEGLVGKHVNLSSPFKNRCSSDLRLTSEKTSINFVVHHSEPPYIASMLMGFHLFSLTQKYDNSSIALQPYVFKYNFFVIKARDVKGHGI